MLIVDGIYKQRYPGTVRYIGVKAEYLTQVKKVGLEWGA